MKNEDNEGNGIENAEYDGGVMTMSASGVDYKSAENEIATVEYCWKTNRKGLYSRLTEQINEKLNQAIQELEYSVLIDPIVLYFSCSTIAKHFADQLESRGWSVTLAPDDDVVQVDIVESIDQSNKGVEATSQAHYFNQDDLLSLN